MEFLITIIIIGAALFFLPYAIAAVAAVFAIFVTLLVGFVALIKSFGRKS
jgi:predicted anti-sigma-YlaC factor YlaD